ncbi:upstream stimulatory factor 1-like, partial [Orbicella faveolata]|uniref:upstream stimulatory factor 1-like n=1 Tax=Orbicella faveolata TaxID=48498 RepID=UPI0009E22812
FVLSKTSLLLVPASNGLVQKNLPALQNTTKPIPASVFSYRFASPTSNQTPYYVSSDIVLSGGIAQQTRRRIVHNEVERRRKDKINNWILKLADVVPQCSWGKQSKNIVLEKTVEYINQVNTQLKELSDLQQREQKLGKGVPPCVLY